MRHHFSNRASICYLFNSKGEILLQRKSRGFGKGKWNGPGGKARKDEIPKECAIREVREETGIKVFSPELRGELEFIFLHKPADNFYSYVFICRHYQGEPIDKGEGELRWFGKANIPLEQMWDDDKHWLPEMLEGKFVRKRFYFDEKGQVSSYFNINGK